jgi:AraC-like DNA-binding protein
VGLRSSVRKFDFLLKLMIYFYYTVIGSAAFQGILLALALLKVQANRQSAAWLSALLVAISACLVGRIFYEESLFVRYPKIAIGSDLLLFVYGVLIFWYVKSVFYEDKPKLINIAPHFIPAFLHLLWLSQFFIVSDATIFTLLPAPIHVFMAQLTEILGWLHIIFYLIIAFRVYKNYPAKAKAFVSNLSILTFFRAFFTLNFMTLSLWIMGFILLKLNSNIVSIIFTYNSIWLILTGSVYLVGYYAVVFPQVFRINSKNTFERVNQGDFALIQEEMGPESTVMSFEGRLNSTSPSLHMGINGPEMKTLIVKEKSPFVDNQIAQEALKLESYMSQAKPFLDPNLTLPMLAGQLPTTVHVLSKVINETFDKNFFDYINGYRVEYFRALVKEPKNKSFTLLSLAFESGFSSKSTFNMAFKKVMHKTPSQYVKELSSN